MNITKAKQAVRSAYKANLPIMLSGSPGLGKSTIVEELTKELELESGEPMGLIIFKPQTADIAEMGDLRWILEREGKAIMQNVQQGWVPTIESVERGEHPAKGILFLDELLDCAPAIQSVLQGLVLDRQLGSAKLAPGWYTMAASNRRKDNAAAGRMSSALARRFVHINIDPDVDATVAYAYAKNWHAMVPAMLRFRPSLLDTHEQSKKNPDDYAFANPASWEKLSTLLKTGMPEDLKLEMMAGVIGKGPAAEFYAFERVYRDLPDMNSIRNSPATAQIPEEPSVLYATLGALCAGITKKDFIRIWPFISRLSAEFATCFVKDCVGQIGPDMVNNNPAWDDYLIKFASYTY